MSTKRDLHLNCSFNIRSSSFVHLAQNKKVTMLILRYSLFLNTNICHNLNPVLWHSAFFRWWAIRLKGRFSSHVMELKVSHTEIFRKIHWIQRYMILSMMWYLSWDKYDYLIIIWKTLWNRSNGFENVNVTNFNFWVIISVFHSEK